MSASAANKLTPLIISGSANQADLPYDTGAHKFKNDLATALRAAASRERDLEDERLRKRQARATGSSYTPSVSLGPSTPGGSVAPETGEKVPTKKELKKKADKVNEAASHAAANVTTAKFLGGGKGRFGKQYSWMTGGGSAPASGANTPSRIQTQGLAGTPSAAAARKPERLTAEGVRRLGEWREDSIKGKKIQIREWITVLENDGMEKRALQKAYACLDTSEPK